VVVRRSSDDLAYDLKDVVHPCEPGDNLHPTFGQSESYFSSFGCQTVLGMANTSGAHSGPWARFRTMAGQKTRTGVPGTPYCYVLFTGREAMLAADLRKNGLAEDSQSLRGLRRLRFGSHGEAVSRLQVKLGITNPDGDFGPATASRLYKLQGERNGGKADGIYSPALDEELGWQVFSAAGV
jgi:endonuclease G